MDLLEPRWRTNYSFSPPPPSRIWDCRSQTDSTLNGPGASAHGTSLSSNSKGSRSRVAIDTYPNHHHSVSDGALSYSGSPLDNVQASQWTSPVQKYKSGSRSEGAWLPPPNERRYIASASAASCSNGSPSLSESIPWESSGKQPSLTIPNCNFPSRRSFMSKPVYPLVIHNPVSDCETTGDADISSIDRSTAGKDMILPSHWPESSPSIDHKFHKTLTELQKADSSPDPSSSSRREGLTFQWSSASSYDDMGFDGDHFNVSENMDLDGLRSPNYQMEDKKCGVCGKLLWQKSPWSSNGIMRGVDLPIAGILPCGHVFHVECLEQVTPKTEVHDPPCHVCLKTIGSSEDSPPVSESLVMALKSVRRRRGVTISGSQENASIDEVFNYMEDSATKTSSSSGSRQKGSSSLVKNQFKRQLSSKGKMAKDFFSTKVLRRTCSSSSSSTEPVKIQISPK